jgi:phage protein U
MLMSLGQFVWGINTLAYQQLQRQNNYRWAANNRVGQRPARQFLGPGDDTITLSGWISPELCGDRTSLDQLRLMAEQGTPYVLVDATGTVFGLWVIEGLSETGTIFRIDGKARRIEFTVTLNRVDDDRIDQVGMITSAQDVIV